MKNLKQMNEQVYELVKVTSDTEWVKELVDRVGKVIEADKPPIDFLRTRYLKDDGQIETSTNEKFCNYFIEYFISKWPDIADFIKHRAHQDMVAQTKATKKAMLSSLGMDMDEEVVS